MEGRAVNSGYEIMHVGWMERCSGNTEEEIPATAQSRCEGRLHRAVTCQLGLEGFQADEIGRDEVGRPGFALPRLKEQRGRRHRGTKSTMSFSVLFV